MIVSWAGARLTLPTRAFRTQILGDGGHNVPPIRYACYRSANLMKLGEINQLDKWSLCPNF